MYLLGVFRKLLPSPEVFFLEARSLDHAMGPEETLEVDRVTSLCIRKASGDFGSSTRSG